MTFLGVTVHTWLDLAFIAASVAAMRAPDRRGWQVLLAALVTAAVSAAAAYLGFGFLSGASAVTAVLFTGAGLRMERRNRARSARGGGDPQA